LGGPGQLTSLEWRGNKEGGEEDTVDWNGSYTKGGGDKPERKIMQNATSAIKGIKDLEEKNITSNAWKLIND